jgi:putative ABC transport system permease protein
MFAYYLDLAVRSLRRNRVLTALMVLALALGIGACITTLTVLKLLSGDPLPQKSSRVFYPQVDPKDKDGYDPGKSKPEETLTYTDATNLLNAHRGVRQTMVAVTSGKVTPTQAGERPFFSDGVMTTADFFPMFDVPFKFGRGWNKSEDDNGARVVVIADFLNEKLFHGANSVGRILRVSDHDYTIIGVTQPWAPQPRFYAADLGSRGYGDGDALFLPLRTARADKRDPQNINCYQVTDIEHLETAPCTWLGYWVELPSASDAAAYKQYLAHYVEQQIAVGRFHRPEIALLDLPGWMRETEMVPGDVRLQAGLAFGFLVICIVNTVGLLLAKCLRRSQEIGVRRALGATRRAIFYQFMVEAAIVGLAGGIGGLVFAELGLWGIRNEPAQYAHLATLDLSMFVFTFVVALLASLVAGLLPAWRACVLAPAPQLKSA